MRHTEELGALPGPSRITMINESMKNLKAVMRARDQKATDLAIKLFNERVEKGVYRYPPGPQPPPGTQQCTSYVAVTCAKKIPADRIREIFGRFDVADSHKGISDIKLDLGEGVLAAKQAAEVAWIDYQAQLSDHTEYTRASAPSYYDRCVEVELAPGEYLEEEVTAGALPVPPPLEGVNDAPAEPLARMRWEATSKLERYAVQLGHFPNITMAPPPAPPERPVHPDEIEGPWVVTIEYDSPEGAQYAMDLGVTKIDGVAVTVAPAHPKAEPYAKACPLYDEVIKKEQAWSDHMNNWPHFPTWRPEWSKWTKRKVHEIVRHNWSNVIDYTEREALLTGINVYEPPMEIDYTCGSFKVVPPWAKPPESATLPNTPFQYDGY
jgi:large subunit ribosomal protein L47